MFSSGVRVCRYLRGWLRGCPGVDQLEVRFDRDGHELPASLFLPPGRREGLPGWVVLHGITRPGRAHPSLLRFARALACTRAAVFVPEIPEWRALQLAPDRTQPTIRAAARALEGRPEVRPGAIGVVGFSFGAPQALIAANSLELRGHVKGVVGFGGYCDLDRTLLFQLTGEHVWEGIRYRTHPDAYGRWVVVGNFLTAVPEFADAADVADALLALAAEAGDRRIYTEDAELETLKARLRETVAPERRELFDLLAPPAGKRPDPQRASDLVRSLGPWVRRSAPLMDPMPYLRDLHVPVRLLHGAHDRLIPFTESLRLARALPADADVRVRVTHLFEHSRGRRGASSLRWPLEALRFCAALGEVLAIV